jgi:Fe-S-cluster containining protein
MGKARKERGAERRPGRQPPPSTDGLELDARRSQRLQTRALLQNSRTPLQVIQIAEHAGTLAEQAIEQAIRQSPPRRPFTCREGCAWCCHKTVGTSAPEVIRIAAFLRERLSTEQWEALRERIRQRDEQRRTLLHHDPWAAARLPCALLVDNRCSVYPVRPLTCRGYNSSDAAACEQSVRSRGRVEVPLYAPQQRLTTFVLDGLCAGLTESGLKGERLELTAALRVSLTIPDATERWLAGEAIFAEARLP